MTGIDEEIFALIKNHSGIILSDLQKEFVSQFARSRRTELSLDEKKYADFLKTSSHEFSLLINCATVNETYFFRESPQFDFLKNEFFPSLKDSSVSIWSAACASGEEAVSLFALASSCSLVPEILATDIDTEALEKFRSGIYTKKSLRSDGSGYHEFLNAFANFDGEKIEVKKSVLEKIKILLFNLHNFYFLPVAENSVDLIFLRNVCIYFSEETCFDVLSKLSRALKPGGVLLVSMSEISAIKFPSSLKKENWKNVYYLRKIGGEENFGFLKKYVSSMPKKKSAEKIISENSEKKSAEKIDEPDENLKNLYRKIFALLDFQRLEEAEKIVSEFDFKNSNLVSKFFLEGYIFFVRGKYENAAELLYKSTLLDREFWPAFLLLGLANRRLGNKKESAKNFQLALKNLEDYLKNKKVCYNFALDKFSSEYFLEICRRNLENL